GPSIRVFGRLAPGVSLEEAQAELSGIGARTAAAFPLAHQLWVPLRRDSLEHAPGEGPAIRVFGRLAPGVSLEAAQVELATLGRRAAAAFPRTHEHLRPQLLPYARSFIDFSGWESVGVMSGNLVLLLLLVLVCGNVAMLLFARAATRESELVVRTALGATRGRIVTQLFAEALVLGAAAAVVGLAAAAIGMRWLMGVLPMIEEKLPFWFHGGLSPATVLYAGALTLLGAVIAGVVPALKVTRGLGARLKQATAGGGGLKFGGIWTAVIVTQVAVTVAVPLHAYVVQGESVQLRSFDPGMPAAEYLSARLEMDREPPPGAPADTSPAALAARFAATYRELARRLEADPAVLGVTFADNLPGMIHPSRRIEVEGGTRVVPDSASALRVSHAAVDIAYFDVLGTPIVAGRAFHAGDLAPDRHVVIVNQSFVHDVLGGRNPIGRRVRYEESPAGSGTRAPDDEPGPWYEIVGVVRDLGMTGSGGRGTSVAGLYHPVAPGAASLVHLAVHVRGSPAAFAPRLRTLAAAVDPTLRLHQVVPLDGIYQGVLRWLRFLFWVTVLGISIAVILSLAGIYAVLSFTVARRTREIGIRVALGADPRHVVQAIFRRPLAHVSLGVAAGAVLAALLVLVGTGGGTTPSLRGAALLAAYAVLMLGVCLLACIVPTRRALGVEPTEALRADG
ncbi:MAG TPA: FtsX-like permease family protein, partial [Gemmatimonadaceae bacterium]|nr:FtsX-like permease family protein [Gemmatimonadaceae bacterium]